jgi:hypothetical protein
VAQALPAEALCEHVERDVGAAAGNVTMIRIARRGVNDVDNDAAFALAHARVDDAREIHIAEHFDR